jgi:hypothetical protein
LDVDLPALLVICLVHAMAGKPSKSSDSFTAADASSDGPTPDDGLKPGLAGDDDTAPSPLSELSGAEDEDEDETEGGQDGEKDLGLGHDADHSAADSASRDGANSSPPRPNGVAQKLAGPRKDASPQGHFPLPPLDQNHQIRLHMQNQHQHRSPTSPPGQNPKVIALLDVNAELFKSASFYFTFPHALMGANLTEHVPSSTSIRCP